MIGKRYCPQCDSEDVDMVSTGANSIWICKECGHSGANFPEKTIIGAEMGEEIDDEDLADEIEMPVRAKIVKKATKKTKAKKGGKKKR